MKHLIALILFYVSSGMAEPLPAVTPGNLCQAAETTLNRYVLKTGSMGTDCFFSLKTNRDPHKYREYLFGTDGGLLITIVTGPGKVSEKSSCIRRYFLPLSRDLYFNITNEMVEVRTPNGAVFTFNTLNEQYEESNEGLSLYKIAFPFTMGSDPKNDLGATVYVDLEDKHCEMENLHLLHHQQGKEPVLVVRSAEELEFVVKNKCKGPDDKQHIIELDPQQAELFNQLTELFKTTNQ